MPWGGGGHHAADLRQRGPAGVRVQNQAHGAKRVGDEETHAVTWDTEVFSVGEGNGHSLEGDEK